MRRSARAGRTTFAVTVPMEAESAGYQNGDEAINLMRAQHALAQQATRVVADIDWTTKFYDALAVDENQSDKVTPRARAAGAFLARSASSFLRFRVGLFFR